MATGISIQILHDIWEQLDEQLKAITAEADKMGITIYEMRNPDGTWPAKDLIVLRAKTALAIFEYTGRVKQ